MFIKHYEKLVPMLFKEAFLEDFQQSNPSLLVFVKDWIKKPTPLFVHGEYGVGKTHFVYALVRELVTKYPSLWPEFYSSPNLDGSLLEAIKSDLEDRYLIKKVCEADVLIIDDIGREMKTDRLKRQLFEILTIATLIANLQ
jgi:DNA replication protein DnaC